MDQAKNHLKIKKNILQGVPKTWELNDDFYIALLQAGLFSKHNFVLSHLEHLSPKNTNKKILIIKNVVFFSVNFKIDGKLGILSRFQFIQNQQNCLIV